MTRRLIPLVVAALILAPVAFSLTAAEVPATPAEGAKIEAKKNLLGDTADEAWKQVKASMNPPLPPKDWNGRTVTDQEQSDFRTKMAEMAGVAADKAKEFYTRFPDHVQAAKARENEREMLGAAVRLGDETRLAGLNEAGGPPSREPAVPQDELMKKLREAGAKARKKESEGAPAVAREFERSVRALQQEYPDRPEIYLALLEIAEDLGPAKALDLAKEIEAAKTEPAVKQQAAGLRKKLQRMGQPVSIAFTAVDGRKVDLLQMKGKVVLIDFWATWCGPCVAELPNVKAVYEKLHPKGFEIVGISFDQEKESLEKFVKKKGMPWPQYFDGEGWSNSFGKEFGINSIPAMWLIDKQGNLRDENGREDLADKVGKMLEEK